MGKGAEFPSPPIPHSRVLGERFKFGVLCGEIYHCCVIYIGRCVLISVILVWLAKEYRRAKVDNLE